MLALILAISDPVKRDLVLDLYLNYQGKCLAIAFSIVHGKQAAEDIWHDVFEKLIKDPDILEYKTAEENWPYVAIMIKYAGFNHLRKNNRLTLVDDFDDNEQGVPPLADDFDLIEMLSTQETYAQVVKAIMELPDIYKDAILLRYGNDLSNKEISACLGISIENVYKRISRALGKLQAELKDKNAGDSNGK